MGIKLMSTVIALTAAAALAACGSSTSSSSSTTSSTLTSTPSGSTTASTPAATVPGKTIVEHFNGTKGRRSGLSAVKRFKVVRRPGVHAHLNGMQGLSLPQKVGSLINNVVSFWQIGFANASVQLPPASLNLVQGAPVTCGTTQISADSSPEYCAASATIELPLGFVSTRVEPLGDAALLLLLSDLYGYHVESALGALGRGLSSAKLEEIDSCFSGDYFAQAYGEHLLQPSDEAGVNRLLALEAPATGTSPGAVTAADLSTAFNRGLLSNFRFGVCLS